VAVAQVTPQPTAAHADVPFDGLRVLFKADPAAVKKSEKKLWLNTGTIIPVKLLSGMDAPAKTGSGAGAGGGAGGGSQQSPYPVLMVVQDLMKLPNEVRVDARDCFLLGEGIGELSSERVQIRGTALSCVKENGEAVDIDLRGFVNGEDGKLGMRGRVVMKEGALLGRALLAGFVSGISRAFMPYQQGFFVANSPGQAFNLPPGGPLAMAGAAGGMGRAAEILSRNYAQMIGNIFPIIEIDAQREVDFVVGTGREVADYFL
jgi:conjugal transfer pilus assembly protein TraB